MRGNSVRFVAKEMEISSVFFCVGKLTTLYIRWYKIKRHRQTWHYITQSKSFWFNQLTLSQPKIINERRKYPRKWNTISANLSINKAFIVYPFYGFCPVTMQRNRSDTKIEIIFPFFFHLDCCFCFNLFALFSSKILISHQYKICF